MVHLPVASSRRVIFPRSDSSRSFREREKHRCGAEEAQVWCAGCCRGCGRGCGRGQRWGQRLRWAVAEAWLRLRQTLGAAVGGGVCPCKSACVCLLPLTLAQPVRSLSLQCQLLQLVPSSRSLTIHRSASVECLISSLPSVAMGFAAAVAGIRRLQKLCSGQNNKKANQINKKQGSPLTPVPL